MKRILLSLVLSVCSVNVLALEASGSCAASLPDTNPGFCTSFANTAVCECNSLDGNCQTIQDAFSNMVANYGPGVEQAITSACAFGQMMGWAPQQTCEDQWHCYLNGGVDSKGGSCYGSTGPKSYCQKLSSVEMKK